LIVKTFSTTCINVPNFVILEQTVKSVTNGDPPEKSTLASSLSRSFKVSGTETNGSATYDFLLVTHNHGPVLPFPRYVHSFRYNARVWRTDRRRDFLNSIALCIHRQDDARQ